MVAKTMAGLEEVLAEELVGLGANNLQIGNRMVSFEGNLELLYRANFQCRTALRILRPVYQFKARTTDDIYKKVKAMNWAEHLSVEKTFAIDAVTFSNYFTHSKFVAYRVKDAIADYFLAKTGQRPNVDIENPDLLINFHVSEETCTLSFDSSGESLHKRGYRMEQTEAPLNEVLAAGIILKTGWKGDSDFIDPMCGSGTFLIEAALIAKNIAPGVYRKSFAFEKWENFDSELLEEIFNDDSAEREFAHQIIGSDIDHKAVAISKANIKNAGLANMIQVEVKDMQSYEKAPFETGLLIANPPYGERLKPESLDNLYSMIGERLKHVFTGYTAWILSYKKECFDKIGLKPSKKFPFINGSLPCELRKYDIFAGKKYADKQVNL
jgi:putative N6-adenine-specific DNA methylase